MFVKQITQNEALNLAAKGIEVMTMIPDSENNANWNAMTPDTLQNLLSGLMFFRREPALENPIIEEEEEEISTPPRRANKVFWRFSKGYLQHRQTSHRLCGFRQRTEKESSGGHREAACPAQGRMDNRKNCG